MTLALQFHENCSFQQRFAVEMNDWTNVLFENRQIRIQIKKIMATEPSQYPLIITQCM